MYSWDQKPIEERKSFWRIKYKKGSGQMTELERIEIMRAYYQKKKHKQPTYQEQKAAKMIQSNKEFYEELGVKAEVDRKRKEFEIF